LNAIIAIGKPDSQHVHSGEGVDFAQLVGPEAWWRLVPAIRRRFAEKALPQRPILYSGVMQKVECSAIGRLVAMLCIPLGRPFAPHHAGGVPVRIILRYRSATEVVWEREYRYPGRLPARVRSIKRVERGGLIECVAGLGMRLSVFEAGGALHFLSLRYFCTLFGRRVWLPALLTPGTAHVVHADLGGGAFRFTMTFHHPLFGTLFHQDGIFRRDGGQQSGDSK
jgi:hypothetical protein